VLSRSVMGLPYGSKICFCIGPRNVLNCLWLRWSIR
jgi:hypothetical protein